MSGGHETESYMQRTTLKLDKTILLQARKQGGRNANNCSGGARIQVLGNTIRVLQAKLK